MVTLAAVVATLLQPAVAPEAVTHSNDAVNSGWRRHAMSLSSGRVVQNLQVTALSWNRDSTAGGAAWWKFGQRCKPRRDQGEQHSAIRACRAAVHLYNIKVYSIQDVVIRERENTRRDG